MPGEKDDCPNDQKDDLWTHLLQLNLQYIMCECMCVYVRWCAMSPVKDDNSDYNDNRW